MPLLTRMQALGFADDAMESMIEDEDSITIEGVVKWVLTESPGYYASNPADVEKWITGWMNQTIAESEDRRPIWAR